MTPIPIVPAPSLLRYLPRPRYATGATSVTWTSRCPHGAVGEWRSVRVDTRAVVTVDCPCLEEDAA